MINVPGLQDTVATFLASGAAVLASRTDAPPGGCRVVRLRPDGALDDIFGPGGSVDVQCDLGFGDLDSVASGSRGDILLGAAAGLHFRTPVLVRLDAGGGSASVFSDTVASHLLVQEDGRALVAGAQWNSFGLGYLGHVLLRRYLADLSLDPTFGQNGSVESLNRAQGFNRTALPFGLGTQASGRIVLGTQVAPSATSGAFVLEAFAP